MERSFNYSLDAVPRRPAYDRDALIDRARDLFWQRGWAGTSMKDLEAALDLRPGSFYAAFGSKDALYGLALDRYAAEGTARLDALADEHGPLGALKAHLHHVATPRKGASSACMLARTLLELKAQEHALADRASDHLDAMEARFAALFRAAQAGGEIAPDRDPERLARRYQSNLLGLRVSAERPDLDAAALAAELADDLDRLAA